MNGSNKSVRDVAKKNLLHIQKHAYLASIRDTIANLPAAEQESFTQFLERRGGNSQDGGQGRLKVDA